VRDREPLVADSRIIAGRYILLHQIGRGTMSEVFAAEQPQLGRTVAIKLLHRDPEVMRRFYSEVRAVGQLRHEHVVTIHDSGHTEDGRPYLAMEFLAGEDLASHLKQRGPMQGPRAMLLWRQAVSAVAAAHRRQVVHRDIKPANLFLTYKEGDEGPEEIIKVIDFSIAKLINAGREPRPTEPGAIVGTVLYMAPEQLESGEATPRSDVYSLGLVLMEMLTGRLPWGGAAGDQIEVGNALLRLVAAPTSLRELQPEQPFSEELLQLARDVLSRDPRQRPTDAGELLRRIKLLPEMREWQRLPRRLSWPPAVSPAQAPHPDAVPELDSTDRTTPEVAPAGPPSDLPPGERADRAAPPAAAVAPPRDPVVDDSTTEQTSPEGSPSKSSWSLGSSGVPELNDDWAEPTIPAGAVAADSQLRSLVASLAADSRQARAEPEPLPAVPPVKPAAPASRPGVQPLPGKEDSNSNSSGNGVVWSAAELDRRLHAHQGPEPPPSKPDSRPSAPASARPAAVPDTISEQPTVPTGHPQVSLAAIELASAASPVAGPSAAPSQSAGPQPPRRPLGRYLRSGAPSPGRRAVWGVMALGAAAALYAVGFRGRTVDRPQGPPAAAPVPAGPDGAAGPPFDLSSPAPPPRVDAAAQGSDLAAAVPPEPAEATGGRDRADLGPPEVPGLLRVRFVYGDDEGVSDLACEPQQGPPRRVSAQHRITVKVALLPGALCKVSGPNLSRSYSYEQLARSRPDRTGEVRFRVRGPVTSRPDEDPTPGSAEVPAPAPEATPPAAAEPPEGAGAATAPGLAPKPPPVTPPPAAGPP
jgi:serine/threonine-protein kinase